jgi:hypothetical protein
MKTISYRIALFSGFSRFSLSQVSRSTAVTLIALVLSSFPFCGKLLATDKPTSQFTIELANELGVKATIDVTGFTSGKDTWGDREHDYITQELNYLGGAWVAQPHQIDENGDFENSRLVMTVPGMGLVLIPWQSFKSLSVQDGVQLVRLNDGTEYKGRLRTILKANLGSEERDYDLSGAISITIVQMPKQVAGTKSPSPAPGGILNGSQWKITKTGMSDLIVTQPRFVYSTFIVTSGGGIFEENGHFATQISEQFGVGLKKSGGNVSDSATVNDFESISVGGDSDISGIPVTVTAKGADAVSGTLAPTPFGLETDEYLNRSLEVACNLPNGCSIVFSVSNGGNELKLERIHPTDALTPKTKN